MANEIVQTLTNNLDETLNAVTDALPKDFNKSRFLQNSIAAIKANPELTKYNQTELLTCLIRGAYLGLDFMNKECWIVPYKGHVQFQTGYKGDCKFVKKYSIRPLLDLKAELVRDGDVFDYGIENNKPYLTFKPKPFNTGKILGVFAIAYFKDGGVLYEVMNPDEIVKVRRTSQAASSQFSPWSTWTEEMMKKSVLRRLCKSIETDFDNIEQREAWEKGSGIDFTKPESAEVHNPFAEDEKITDEIVIDTDSVKIEDVPDDINDMPLPDAFKEIKG